MTTSITTSTALAMDNAAAPSGSSSSSTTSNNISNTSTSTSSTFSSLELRKAKRQRLQLHDADHDDNDEQEVDVEDEDLYELCLKQQWTRVQERVSKCPHEAKFQTNTTNRIATRTSLSTGAICATSTASGTSVASCHGKATPLALACRAGAPFSCIQALLQAAPEHVRVLLSSRGTPIHEAIICERIQPDVIQLLLQVDENIDKNHNHPTHHASRSHSNGATLHSSSQRAALMQDVDGHTPLHLLIRRRTPGHILLDDNSHWMSFFKILVQSCPEAVGIADRGEYEEPPLVMALKANQYAAVSADIDDLLYPRIELRIHEMVAIMLTHYPQAASLVLEGARGQYTALHSAVFHGRCSNTIQLLLQAEAKTLSSSFMLSSDASHDSTSIAIPTTNASVSSRAALLANTQGEIPLHFAAMRGEPPRTMGLLGNAAPMAVRKRDSAGLTPLHWLWIRFVSTVSSLDERQLTDTVELGPRVTRQQHDHDDNNAPAGSLPHYYTEVCAYSKFWHAERGDFSHDLILIRHVDPPIDFFRMRHIPPELYEGDDPRRSNLCWAERAAEVLDIIRIRSSGTTTTQSETTTDEWTREEVVSCLFWVKVVSLLKAVSKTQQNGGAVFHLVHTAMSCPSCPPPVAHITALLFPSELTMRDSNGRYPLHLAAKRDWHSLDWPMDGNDSAANKLLTGESLQLFANTLALSTSPHTTRVVDTEGRLVLNHLIETFVHAFSRCRVMTTMHHRLMQNMLLTLKNVIQRYPEALERRDGPTKLYPFLQATASASKYAVKVPFPEETSLSVVYTLLRENPLLVNNAIPSL